MTSRRMFRYEVPVDDQPHVLMLTGYPVAVSAKWPDFAVSSAMLVEFWAEHDEDAGRSDRVFQVFGTGQPLPPGAHWIGTCPRIGGLVWHLYEVTP